MRVLFCLLCFATPAAAWEASSVGPVCLLSQMTDKGSVVVSHDPRNALPYAIQLSRQSEIWKDAPLFALQFDGPGRITITTERHQLADNNAELIVTDRGFDNVLRGLEANFVALAVLGNQSLVIPLNGAAPEVAKFRSCATGAGA